MTRKITTIQHEATPCSKPLTGLPAVLGTEAAFNLIAGMRTDEAYVMEQPRTSDEQRFFETPIGGMAQLAVTNAQ